MAKGAGQGLSGREIPRDVGLADIALTPPMAPEKGAIHLAALQGGVKDFLKQAPFHKDAMPPGLRKSALLGAGVKQ